MEKRRYEVTGFGRGMWTEHSTPRAAWYMANHEARLTRRLYGSARIVVTRVYGDGNMPTAYTVTR